MGKSVLKIAFCSINTLFTFTESHKITQNRFISVSFDDFWTICSYREIFNFSGRSGGLFYYREAPDQIWRAGMYDLWLLLYGSFCIPVKIGKITAVYIASYTRWWKILKQQCSKVYIYIFYKILLPWIIYNVTLA